MLVTSIDAVLADASLLGIDNLLAEIILAIGAALVVGMGLALFGPALRQRYGVADPAPSPKAPSGAGERLTGRAKARAAFLFTVGLLMAIWGIASMLGK